MNSNTVNTSSFFGMKMVKTELNYLVKCSSVITFF